MNKIILAAALKIVKAVKSEPRDSIYSGGPTYCQHGTYVGDWFGGDYMCGWCEGDVSLYAYALIMARQDWNRTMNALRDEAITIMFRERLDAAMALDQSALDTPEKVRALLSTVPKCDEYARR